MATGSNKVFFTPGYISKFQCIGQECIDNCCMSGWNIQIDKKTYKKYKNSSNEIIRSISQKYLVKEKPDSDIAYIKNNKINNSCPFLTDKNLCSAHNLLGNEGLSIGCSTYPRVIKNFKKIGFIAGHLSCPEVARLCLGNSNLKIKKLLKNQLKNVFNAKNIHSFESSKDLPENFMEFVKDVFFKLNNNDTLYNTLKEIIVSYYKIRNKIKDVDIFSNEQKEKLKENNLLLQINFFSKFCFSKLTNHTRYHKICKLAAEKSKFFSKSEIEFKKKYIYNYKYKFNKFQRENSFIFKNIFFNEFIKNIEKFEISTNAFDNFIRETLCLLNLSNFLMVCQLFESKKELTVNDYIEVISAVSKNIQIAEKKTELIVNLFKKFDNDDLYRRLLDVY